ncbi:MAG: glycosyltransferase family 4 protein [Actinomycetota bacterium]
MRVLLWHGYLLSGSGSNIYTAHLARSWRRAGHDVLLMCQERNVADLEFVDAHGDFAPDNEGFEVRPTGVPPGPGRVRMVRPAIGGLLPVYVYDDYEGFVVKRFVDLTDEELDSYTEANMRALVTALEAHDPDAVITGHEVMGPYIAREACARTGHEYLAKLHGSALEYAVKEQERYLRYATDGLGGAKVVAGGSRYMVAEASTLIPSVEARAVVVNPGCDVDLFVPRGVDEAGRPTIGFVGKLIVAKGVHHLLAALGLIDVPGLRVVVVGYGGFEDRLRALWSALQAGDEGAVRHIAAEGDGRPLGRLVEWLESGAADDAYWARTSQIRVDFTGRLEHGPLSQVLPYFDALVVPSIVAEAFGMVAAEAAACGVLPIVPNHSGIQEVGSAVEVALSEPGLLTFDATDPIAGIARAAARVLAIPAGRRAEMGHAAAALARSRWSWDAVADRLLGLAAR